MGALAGFLDNSQSLLGIAAGLGLARHFRVPVRSRSYVCSRLIGRLRFVKIGQLMVSNGVIWAICSYQDDGVKWGHWSHL